MVASRQERMTHKDTIDNQKELIAFIRSKINGIPYFINQEEKYNYFELVANSILSQGPMSKIVPRIRVNGVVIPLGKDIHHFANQMMNVDDKKVVLKYNKNRYYVDTKKLWKILLDYCLMIFPMAQAEAMHMSREVTKMEQRTLGYTFDTSKRL